MKSYIVLTTINLPSLLEEYADNFEKFGHRNNTGFIVIGDLKTPKEAKAVCDKLQQRGFEATYMDVSTQKEWLKKFPELDEIIPYNSDNRRNIGYLVALEKGAEMIISLDDDNYVGNYDFFGEHSVVGKNVNLPTVYSSNGWYNICSLLENDRNVEIYPRGFPYSKRFDGQVKIVNSSAKIALNLGLWTRSPDADAMTNLTIPVKMMRFQNYNRIMLGRGTFSPVNTQNTAFHVSALPCYYCVLMGVEINGMKLDRYGDIWGGFFAKKIIDHMDERVSVGKPLSIHERNEHDLFKDLQNEFWGMIFTERISEWITSLSLESSKDYGEAYLELAKKLSQSADSISSNNLIFKKYLKKLSHCMQVWVETCNRIMS